MSNSPSSVRDRALSLLGQGIGPEMVASALGVTTSAISQLLSTSEFAAEVSSLRFENLSRHNERDATYDSMEEDLQKRMKDIIPWLTKPFEILRAIQIINAAKRRGSSAPEMIHQQNQVVSLTMPTAIIQQFTKQDITVNINNQVVRAGSQDLVTIQSGSMDSLLTASNRKQIKQDENHVATSDS